MSIFHLSNADLDARIEQLSKESDLADSDEERERIDAALESAYDERERRADDEQMYPHDEHVGLDTPAGYGS